LIHERTEALLAQFQARGIKLGLDKVRELLRRIGPIPSAVPVIQVAGTNGKGSVVHGLEAIATAHGVHTGLFTSPHLVSPTERIRIGGVDLADDEFDRRAAGLARALETWAGDAGELGAITYFEFLFGLAVQAFTDRGVDLVLLEVGLGGRADATTVSRADATCITSIAMDHEAFLGPDVASIAREKAGIVRPHVPLWIGPMPAEARDVVRERARELRAPLHEIRPDPVVLNGMCGDHQRVNAALSLALAGAVDLPDDDVTRAALAGARVPGRCERIEGEPEILLDGSHNPAGAIALGEVLDQHPVVGTTDLVFGVGADKDAVEILRPLVPRVRRVYVTEYASGRVPAPAAEIAGIVARLGGEPMVCEPAAAALRRAVDGAGAGDRVVVAGSLFLVGELRALARVDS
jgi:dihydrofolate synthase / folylpolyglutamate synthase